MIYKYYIFPVADLTVVYLANVNVASGLSNHYKDNFFKSFFRLKVIIYIYNIIFIIYYKSIGYKSRSFKKFCFFEIDIFKVANNTISKNIFKLNTT